MVLQRLDRAGVSRSEIVQSGDARSVPNEKRQLFHLAVKDRVFVESLINPHSALFGRYVLGTTRRLYSTVASTRRAKSGRRTCTTTRRECQGRSRLTATCATSPGY